MDGELGEDLREGEPFVFGKIAVCAAAQIDVVSNGDLVSSGPLWEQAGVKQALVPDTAQLLTPDLAAALQPFQILQSHDAASDLRAAVKAHQQEDQIALQILVQVNLDGLFGLQYQLVPLCSEQRRLAVCHG